MTRGQRSSVFLYDPVTAAVSAISFTFQTNGVETRGLENSAQDYNCAHITPNWEIRAEVFSLPKSQ
jgi:hypothetical protein